MGRKVIVLITDGIDEGSKLKIEEAIEASQKSDVVIYSIDYADPSAYGRSRSAASAISRCKECPARPAAAYLRWTADIAWTTPSRNCRTKCAASIPSPTRRPTRSKDG